MPQPISSKHYHHESDSCPFCEISYEGYGGEAMEKKLQDKMAHHVYSSHPYYAQRYAEMAHRDPEEFNRMMKKMNATLRRQLI